MSPRLDLSTLAVSVLLLAAALSGPAAAQTADRRAVAQAVAAELETTYIFPDKAAEAARLVRERASSGAYDRAADERAFVQALTADLFSVTQDKHLVVRWSAAGYPPNLGAPPDEQGDRTAELREMKRTNFQVPKAEVLAGNVGYLDIDGFQAPQDAGPTLTAAMAFLANTDALIFDLRDNGGGDSATVALLISYLVPPQTKLVSFRARGTVQEAQSWSVPFVPGGPWSTTRPVFVLTNGKTFSAAEEFAYDLQELKRAKVVGAQSMGGANPGLIRRLNDHFVMFVPNEAAIGPVSGLNWEGVGVTPDVAVAPETALTAAHRLALEALLAKADPDEKTELEEVLAGLDG